MTELRDEFMTPAQRAKFAAAAGLAPPVDPAPDNEGGPVEQRGADGEKGQVENDQRPAEGA